MNKLTGPYSFHEMLSPYEFYSWGLVFSVNRVFDVIIIEDVGEADNFGRNRAMISLILWNVLPDVFPTHFPTCTSTKQIYVFATPARRKEGHRQLHF